MDPCCLVLAATSPLSSFLGHLRRGLASPLGGAPNSDRSWLCMLHGLHWIGLMFFWNRKPRKPPRLPTCWIGLMFFPWYWIEISCGLIKDANRRPLRLAFPSKPSCIVNLPQIFRWFSQVVGVPVADQILDTQAGTLKVLKNGSKFTKNMSTLYMA